METIVLQAPAKVNLGLDVLRKREDGYHDLRMIMQSIGLFDEIKIEKIKSQEIRLSVLGSSLPADEKNLAYRAAKLLFDESKERWNHFGAEITLTKRIPMAAGLAGGSTDAAAVLIGLNRLFDLGYTKKKLMELGVRLGADIPFCILGGTALAEGIGEKLTELPPAPDCCVLLAKPGISVSTAFVYGNLKADRLLRHPDVDAQIEAIQTGSLRKLAEKMENVLETVTIPAHPVIETIKEEMKSTGAVNAMMSGSGPTVFGLFDSREKAQKALEKIKEKNLAEDLLVTEFLHECFSSCFVGETEQEALASEPKA